MPRLATKPMTAPLILRMIRRAGGNLRERGLADTLRRIRARARAAWLEWRLGIETGGSIDGCRLGHAPDSFGYEPIPYDVWDAFQTRLPPEALDGVLLDLGCGKGRAVVLAGRQPFRGVLGVELSEELCRVAEANIRRAGKFLRCPSVRIVPGDARYFEIPDDVSVLLMFNPFDQPVLACVLEQLEASLRRRPRVLTVGYALPACRRDALGDTDWLEHREDVATLHTERLRLAIYQTQADRLAVESEQGIGR